MDITWSALLETLWEPWYLMLVTLTFIPQTLLKIFRQGQFATLASWHAFQDAWFANTWAVLGPQFAEGSAPVVKELLSRAHGVVLDIGPGAGNWVHLYPNPVKGGGGVTKIFGVEPNLEQHASLRRKVREAGLEDVYEIVGAGAEELGGLGLGIWKGSVDTVVTKQVLCSVPGPERLVRELYGYLKPGGVWIMYEHVKTKEGGWVDWYQGFVDMFWGHCFGGCSLTRSTDEMIRRVGDWQKVKIKPFEGQNAYMPIPGMLGYFVKK